MHNKYVIDSSALLAFINKESGFELVQTHLPNCIMSSVNLSECAAVLSLLSMKKESIEEILYSLIKEIVPFDQTQAIETGLLINLTKKIGLSLGDRACITLAKLKELPVLTADKIWDTLDLNIKIELIR